MAAAQLKYGRYMAIPCFYWQGSGVVPKKRGQPGNWGILSPRWVMKKLRQWGGLTWFDNVWHLVADFKHLVLCPAISWNDDSCFIVIPQDPMNILEYLGIMIPVLFLSHKYLWMETCCSFWKTVFRLKTWISFLWKMARWTVPSAAESHPGLMSSYFCCAGMFAYVSEDVWRCLKSWLLLWMQDHICIYIYTSMDWKWSTKSLSTTKFLEPHSSNFCLQTCQPNRIPWPVDKSDWLADTKLHSGCRATTMNESAMTQRCMSATTQAGRLDIRQLQQKCPC